jgi:hypothetical protein
MLLYRVTKLFIAVWSSPTSTCILAIRDPCSDLMHSGMNYRKYSIIPQEHGRDFFVPPPQCIHALFLLGNKNPMLKLRPLIPNDPINETFPLSRKGFIWITHCTFHWEIIARVMRAVCFNLYYISVLLIYSQCNRGTMQLISAVILYETSLKS